MTNEEKLAYIKGLVDSIELVDLLIEDYHIVLEKIIDTIDTPATPAPNYNPYNLYNPHTIYGTKSDVEYSTKTEYNDWTIEKLPSGDFKVVYKDK